MIVNDPSKTNVRPLDLTSLSPSVDQAKTEKTKGPETLEQVRDLTQRVDTQRSRDVSKLVTPASRPLTDGLQAPAARKSDNVKEATLEQSKAVVMSAHADAAKITKSPTAAQLKEIDDAAKAGDCQKAIDLTVKYYGIDTTNVNGSIKYDAGLTSADASTNSSRQVRIGPSVFSGHSSGFIASTILHEVTHANQVKAHGWPGNGQQVMAYEAMGYQVGLDSAKQLGLNASETTFYRTYTDSNRNGLSKANRALYDSGQYWGMSP